MSARFTVTYQVRSTAEHIEARAQGIAVEQSVEMPLAAIDNKTVLSVKSKGSTTRVTGCFTCGSDWPCPRRVRMLASS